MWSLLCRFSIKLGHIRWKNDDNALVVFVNCCDLYSVVSPDKVAFLVKVWAYQVWKEHSVPLGIFLLLVFSCSSTLLIKLINVVVSLLGIFAWFRPIVIGYTSAEYHPCLSFFRKKNLMQASIPNPFILSAGSVCQAESRFAGVPNPRGSHQLPLHPQRLTTSPVPLWNGGHFLHRRESSIIWGEWMNEWIIASSSLLAEKVQLFLLIEYVISILCEREQGLNWKIFGKKSIAQSTRNHFLCPDNATSKMIFNAFFGLRKFCFTQFLDSGNFSRRQVFNKKMMKSVSFLIIDFSHKNGDIS